MKRGFFLVFCILLLGAAVAGLGFQWYLKYQQKPQSVEVHSSGIDVRTQLALRKNVETASDDILQKINNANLPTTPQYKQTLDEIVQSSNTARSAEDAETVKKNLELLSTRIDSDSLLAQKNILLEKASQIQQKSKTHGLYFAALEGYETEKTAAVEIDGITQTLYQQKFDSQINGGDVQKTIDMQLQPKLEFLQKSHDDREADIAKREQERLAFLAQRAAQDKQNKSLNVQAPASPLPNAPKSIFVSITNQSMYSYEYGIPIQATPVVTGKPGYETVRGTFSIYKKEQNTILRSPFDGIEYSVPVSYWMPFYSGYGIHDAPWRKFFGGDIYKTSGSHGCVNTPANVAAWMFGWAEVGTPVVVD